MHVIYESHVEPSYRRERLATAETLPEAIEKVEAMQPSFLEIDPDYPECADAILHDGRIIVIEPKDFKP